MDGRNKNMENWWYDNEWGIKRSTFDTNLSQCQVYY